LAGLDLVLIPGLSLILVLVLDSLVFFRHRYFLGHHVNRRTQKTADTAIIPIKIALVLFTDLFISQFGYYQKSTSNGCYFKLGSPSLNFSSIWHPSQNGLFVDLPQRQSVTRLRVSYLLPSAPSISIPPFTQTGPLACFRGSSIKPISFLIPARWTRRFYYEQSAGPMGTNTPGAPLLFQISVIRILRIAPNVALLVVAKSCPGAKFGQIIQVNLRTGNSIAPFAYISLFAVSVPSKPIRAWDPSQMAWF